MGLSISRYSSRWAKAAVLAFGVFAVGGLPPGGIAAAEHDPVDAAETESSGEVPVNSGGVLLLHVEGPYELGSYRMCDSLSLGSRDQAVTELPGDGEPYLIGCYAAFPDDVQVRIWFTSFGIRYTSNVRVISLGPCNGGAMIVPGMEWPASGGGVGVPYLEETPKDTQLNTMYWFAVQSDGPGFFEVTPHPVYKLAGTFGSVMPTTEEAITGYGRIGFDQDGRLPVPGERHVRGVCCTPEGCWVVSELECEHYESVYLGPEASCGSRPCGDQALRGGCCLGGVCEEHTWMNCVLLGGIFLGEGVPCDSLPCPVPDNDEKEGR